MTDPTSSSEPKLDLTATVSTIKGAGNEAIMEEEERTDIPAEMGPNKKLSEMLWLDDYPADEASQALVAATRVLDSAKRCLREVGDERSRIKAHAGNVKVSVVPDEGVNPETFKTTVFTVQVTENPPSASSKALEADRQSLSLTETVETTKQQLAKIRDPSGELLTAAFEKYLKKRATEKHRTLADMTEEEREHELETIKHRRFCDFLSMVLSLIYAMSVVLAGVGCYAADIFLTYNRYYAESFHLYLTSAGTLWLVYLHWDIRTFVGRLERFWHAKKSSLSAEIHLVRDENGAIELDLPDMKDGAAEDVPDFYMFSTERHSGSYFLKIGAAIFYLGAVIHAVLDTGKVISFVLEDRLECASVLHLVEHVMMIVYSTAMLVTLFQYSNVIVNCRKGMARFGFMHCIASSLCFWLRDIVRDTYDTVVKKMLESKEDVPACNHEIFELRTGRDRNATDGQAWDEDCRTSFVKFTDDCYATHAKNCSATSDIAEKVAGISPYLFPFSIQYNILIVGIWYIMWHNVANVEHVQEGDVRFVPDATYMKMSKMSSGPESAILSHHDVKTSAPGILVGVLFLVVALIGIVLYFFLQNSVDCGHKRLGQYMAEAFMLLMLFAMTLTSFYCYRILADFEVNPHPVEFLDDLLLFVCIPSFILHAICESTPVVYFVLEKKAVYDEVAQVVTNVFMILQVTVQTPLIVDGLRRCTNDEALRQQKPGRSLVTFLMIANLVIYVWDTFEVKSAGRNDSQSDFYGDFLWTIIKHSTLPLTLFYRFHAAVAFADIWTAAYSPAVGDGNSGQDRYEHFEIVKSLIKDSKKKKKAGGGSETDTDIVDLESAEA